MKKKLLVISPSQFGYLSDYYYYCKYLEKEYQITYICFDEQLKKIPSTQVEVIYIPVHPNKIYRYYPWLQAISRTIKKNKFDLIFTYNFKLCSYLHWITTNTKVVLDIRTGSVKEHKIKNWLQNTRIKLESKMFKHVTIVSDALTKRLLINPGKCHRLPLGAELRKKENRTYHDMNLLYVGTLNNRRIHETIKGFKLFHAKFGHIVKCEYNIFGFGTPKEEKQLNESIKNQELSNIVKFHGRKNINELSEYYQKSTIGVSYIPITTYFHPQPPTKTFEYILSGMICIATATHANLELINKENGILCKDNPESFSQALEKYYHQREHYKYNKVVGSLKTYTWENIVEFNLKPYLNKLLANA